MEIRLSDNKIKANSPDAVESIFKPILAAESEIDQDKEHFWVVGIRGNNRVHYIELVSLGVLNASIAHPREVFRFAIIKSVSHIILVHNHPSGSTTPSEEDRRITAQMINAGNVVGIKVLDHVIIGEDRRSSFQEMGLI